MMMRWLSLGVAFLLTGLAATAADWPQWRGPDRNGVSQESGLLQSWPKDGPKLLWTYRQTGIGFSGPAIVGDILYILGADDKTEYVLCLDLKNQTELWKSPLGPLFSQDGFGHGPRSTPTLDGQLLFALGAHGDLVCLDLQARGKEVWRKSLVKDLGGEMMSEWGYSESPLVDGDLLICTPGGSQGTVAALNKKTGGLVWQSKELKQKAPYSSVVISQAGGVKQYIQNSYTGDSEEGYVSGFSAKDGKLLWSQRTFKKFNYAIGPTPIVQKDLVYVTVGYGCGCHLYQLVPEAGGLFKAQEQYPAKYQKLVKSYHGGVVLLDGHIYGQSEVLGWICQDFKTGAVRWEEKNQLSCRSGSTLAAGERLYFFADDGNLALVVPNPKEWQEVGRLALPEKSKLRGGGTKQSGAAIWTHPVVANGRLYLRDQELLFCYDVRDKK